MKAWLLLLCACSASPPKAAATDAGDAAAPDAAGFPAPLAATDFLHPLDKAHIRATEPWLDDAAFDVMWLAAHDTPINFLGAIDAGYHADLAARATPLPGGLALCGGDAKLNNFGWTYVGGTSVFSYNDFDDSGQCPAAADILHLVLATDLTFSDAALDTAVIAAYADTLRDPAAATAVDPTTAPVWDDERKNGVDSDTKNDLIKLGGELVAPTADENTALRALVAADSRFPTTVVDVAKDLKTTGGSAGMRRYWLLVEDASHPRTILELKELTTPGTEQGPHDVTYDDLGRFDVLKPFWWAAPDVGDHFSVEVLAGRFVARDRYLRKNPDNSASPADRLLWLTAEASLLAQRHRDAWAGVDPDVLAQWLRESSVTLSARWRTAFVGG